MNLDSLLRECREDAPASPALDFDALLARATSSRSRRATAAWLSLATAACFAGWMLAPKPVPKPETVVTVPGFSAAPALINAAVAKKKVWLTPKPKAAPAQAASVWSEFVPLAETSMLPAPGTVQLLRVSVSRDRLSSLGVLPQSTAEDTQITAEVLLGDDGMARAIRVANTR